MTKVLLAATAAALTLAGAPAIAQPQQVTIEYRDLNLESPQGQERLERRIDNAARKACGLDQARTGSRLASPDAISCHRAAVAQAHEHVAAIVEKSSKGG